ncbi:zinc-binding dehydrogenase [Flaviflexus equikiangi]|uniref:Alcohol dehydrogenase catalytic domain-containing protein n=1 Tax=Flaviflexus equikiangi TaxID=2758573 RepID=A0ABS2TDU1_9ACTO|nr:alcohol dehydrogenase catalytic domain-containing protein [Flaviflexus equikiangi]MBM9432513.1 alcohol dehydrogenase catalytic domain-containing protein [Flaviflexus equikiangi]
MLAYEYQDDGKLAFVDRPDPVAGEGDIVIDVAAVGICGTDLKIARGEHRLFPPGTVRVPGHETVGVVRENRSGHDRFAPGTPVAIAPNIACGTCRPCRRGLGNLCENYESVGLTFDGGFAEQLLVPAAAVANGNVLVVPEHLSLPIASLTEPIAAVIRGLRPLALTPDDTLLICGAGPIGLIALLVAKHRGVGRVIVSQTSPHRRNIAEHLGADHTINPRERDLAEQVAEWTDGAGADAIIVATPVGQVFTEALRACAKGGRINFFAGLPSGKGEILLDANLIHYGELLVTGSTANTSADNEEALALLAAEPDLFAPLITAAFPLTEADRAFEAARGGDNLKVLVEP